MASPQLSDPGRTNLYDNPAPELARLLDQNFSPPFRARQIEQWLYEKNVLAFDEMTNLPATMRNTLSESWVLSQLELVDQTPTAEDGSRKYLFETASGDRIETVHMPMATRTTLCVSSQAGCAVGCTFCVTGFFGPGRNLRTSEIVEQVFRVQRLHDTPSEKTNLVFMGMGEPLLNTAGVGGALDILTRKIAPRRITISTSGITPGIEWLAYRENRPNLAVSINAPDQARRIEIMPISKKYPLDELVSVLANYPLDKRQWITAEYVLLAGWNDRPGDPELLARLFEGIQVKLNLIPFNPDPNLPAWMKRPDDQAIDTFANRLVELGMRITVRRSKGLDIAAACGQLRGKQEV